MISCKGILLGAATASVYNESKANTVHYSKISLWYQRFRSDDIHFIVEPMSDKKSSANDEDL